MPLAFPSLNRGTVAFGFFNIETDCLLLDRMFFFCADFCRAVEELALADADRGGYSAMPGFEFAAPADIGDLMGAIHGTSREGFLGEIYSRWPFPEEPGGFRQKLVGAASRGMVEEVLRRRATPREIPLRSEPEDGPVWVADYGFSLSGFLDLLDYVLRGGYPTWEGLEQDRRPPCVERLAAVVGRCNQALQGR